MLKRDCVGVYHKVSPMHLDRCIKEFAGRHNLREQDRLSRWPAW